jgi:hypothetical protein
MKNPPRPARKTPSKAAPRNSPYAMSTARSRLPRQLLWALAIGVLSFLLALLMSH